MVGVDYETPLKMAISIAKGATPDSSGKEILKRYRELVAQKSAERIKSQSLPLENDNDEQSILSSPSSTASSHSASSLGSMSSLDEEDYYNEGGRRNAAANEKKRSMDGCKDDLTNEMVQEATMITNLLKETIREKQQQQQQQQQKKHQQQSKTPAKKKTPSKFNVFQDHDNKTVNDSGLGGSSLKPRNRRSALQPKSTNMQQPTMDKKMKKNSTAASLSSSSTIQKPQKTKSQTLSSKTTATAATTTTTSNVKSSLEKNQQQQQVQQQQEKRVISPPKANVNSCNTNDTIEKTETRNNSPKVRNIVEQKSSPEQAYIDLRSRIEKSKERIVLAQHETNLSAQQNNSQTNNQEEAVDEVKKMEAIITHDDGNEDIYDDDDNVLREDGELLSLGSAASASMLEEEDEEASRYTANSYLQTPTNSIQTFSFAAQSYSLDVSTNGFKNVFMSPTQSAIKKIDTTHSIADNNSSNSDESMTGETVYHDVSVSSENYTNDAVSLTSKILATGNNDESMMISKSSAASLIQRNKTLIKEVRFADQTCVELSERNAGMQRDVKRMEAQVAVMKKDNESLHEVIVQSKQQCAKVEESRDGLTVQVAEQKGYYEAQMNVLQQALNEAKNQNQILNRRVDESNELKLSSEKTLASSHAKYETLQQSNIEANEKVSSLMARLGASQSAAEVSAVSAAESYRKFCIEMEDKINAVERISEDRRVMYNKEKDERVKVEMEKEELMKRCSEIEKIIENKYYDSEQLNMTHSNTEEAKTPNKLSPSSGAQNREGLNQTPTSSVLARTLEAELQRGHDAVERILEAEMIISVTQSELQESSRQLDLARSEIHCLNTQVKKLSKEKNESGHNAAQESEPTIYSDAFESTSSGDSSFGTCSTDELVGQALSQKLTYARSECEGYKKDLESILNEIKRLQGESLNKSSNSQDGSGEQTIPGLLQAVRELAQVCGRQADEINGLKLRGEDRKSMIGQLECVVDEQKEKIAKQNNVIKELKSKMEDISLLCSSQEAELTSTKTQLASVSKQSRKQLNQKQIEIANQQAKCNELVDKVNELSQLCERQSEEMDLMQSSIEKVNKELHEKEHQITTHNLRQECLMNEVEDVVSRITTIKDQYRFQS